MQAPPAERLLAYARDLQRADTFRELLEITRTELHASLGYTQVWLFVAEDDDATMMRLLDAAGSLRDIGMEAAPVLKVADDALLTDVLSGDVPVIVEDARTDPRTNKDLVALVQSRTLIHVPLRLLDRPLGAFGTGTFGDEGCRPPARAQLDYLIGMAVQLSVAAGRIRYLQERARAETEMRKIEDQLRQAQKMEAVGRLAGGIAHDFNNLLSIVISYAEILLSEPEPPASWRHDLEEIQGASKRAADLTRRLLAFSRQHVLTPRVVDVNEVVSNMDGMIRRLIAEDILFETLTKKPVSRVYADPGMIEQVILNLVVNARDAMPHGGKLLVETADVVLDEQYCAAHVGVKPGAYVLVAVSDTGVGMDEATRERIFEPFFTTKAKGQGTGLGLSTVYGLVTQSGGSVWVYSEVGKGTTMRVYFPATEATETAPIHAPREPAKVKGSETILLAEDEAPLRAVVREILERNGYTVIEARDVEHALELGETYEGAIDLLLTDVVMPRLSGGELAEKFAVLRPETAVLFMSGYTENSIVHHQGVASGLSLLAKPITPEALLRKVRDVLDGAS